MDPCICHHSKVEIMFFFSLSSNQCIIMKLQYWWITSTDSRLGTITNKCTSNKAQMLRGAIVTWSTPFWSTSVLHTVDQIISRSENRVFDVVWYKPLADTLYRFRGILTSVSHFGIVTLQLHLICNHAAVSITFAVVNACKISTQGK